MLAGGGGGWSQRWEEIRTINKNINININIKSVNYINESYPSSIHVHKLNIFVHRTPVGV
jgi:hypothetical protein